MTLSTYDWSDDGQFADFKVTSIHVNARINRAVFVSPDRVSHAVLARARRQRAPGHRCYELLMNARCRRLERHR